MEKLMTKLMLVLMLLHLPLMLTAQETNAENQNQSLSKQSKESSEKFNIRKEKGCGVFVNVGGLLTDGIKIGVEPRYNRCILSIFVGVPQTGIVFKNSHKDWESLLSISAGIGCKGIVPAKWGGFYAGGVVQYERYSGDLKVNTLREEKDFCENVGVMANAGFRFQTKCHLYFNFGGMCGPSFDRSYFRHTNILMNDYSAAYVGRDPETNFKVSAEISIGYEF
ncbi:MAG: hypothetical protein IJ916_03185 [Paludibacteraceae bacterium]|nr:hypothetical protein [Paludibacteraceae bacterium]MEE3485045.1 hypothetical protein [Bacteroidales bacterium]